MLLAWLATPGVGFASSPEKMARVAVFPVENLSGTGVPARDIRSFLIGRLLSQGIQVLDDGELDRFMERYRVRYAAGIDAATAEALRQQNGVDGIVIASVELSTDAPPPKLALTARLVSIASLPTVVWADDVGLAGDDAPGLFEVGLVHEYRVLQDRALDRLAASLLTYLAAGEPSSSVKRAKKFRPKTAYRAVSFEPGRPYSVAVVPFFNLSDRRNAGEMLALLFIRHLTGFSQFRVVDTGVVRRQLLDARIIMDGGLSINDAETLAALLDADYVLGGRVTRYDDYTGPAGRTRVEFSTVLVERRSRRVVWSSDSYNEGVDGVRWFERGASRTAHAMATQMVGLTVEMMAGHDR